MAPSIFEQTGWRRPYPAMMLQGWDGAQDLLLKVTACDFDLEDPAFQFYAQQRGLLWAAGAPGSALWKSLCPPWPEIREPWTRITRAKLQDLWELFQQLEAEQVMRLWPRWNEYKAARTAPAQELQAPAQTNNGAEPLGQLSLVIGSRYAVAFYAKDGTIERFSGILRHRRQDGSAEFQVKPGYTRTLYPHHLVAISLIGWSRPAYQILINPEKYLSARIIRPPKWERLVDVVNRRTGVWRRYNRSMESTRFFYQYQVPIARLTPDSGDICKSVSAYLLGEKKPIQPPFEYAGKLWVGTGACYSKHRAEWVEAWSLCPIKEWHGSVCRDSSEIIDAWNEGARARGDMTGFAVSSKHKYVLAEKAIFTPDPDFQEFKTDNRGQLCLF